MDELWQWLNDYLLHDCARPHGYVHHHLSNTTPKIMSIYMSQITNSDYTPDYSNHNEFDLGMTFGMTTRRCGSGKSQSPWKTSQFLRTFTNRDFSHCKPHTNSCKIHDTTWKEWNYQGTISNYDPLPHVPWLESRFNTKFYIVRNVIKDIFISCTPSFTSLTFQIHNSQFQFLL